MDEKVLKIKEKMTRMPRHDQSPEEKKFFAYEESVRALIDGPLVRYNLKMHKTGEVEFIIFQGTLSNVWARVGLKEKAFYRTVLERQFEKAGLLEPSNSIVIRH